MAQAFNRLGSRVEVIQRRGQILSRENRDMADAVLDRLRGEKIRFHMDTTMAAAVHPYPTLAEINKRVAGDVLASKLFFRRVKKALAFFFHLKRRACGTD